jgi:hypothetical protein
VCCVCDIADRAKAARLAAPTYALSDRLTQKNERIDHWTLDERIRFP